jgi:cell division protein FtsI/penicillin-binding protein 2
VSGEILAMTSRPNFNPGSYKTASPSAYHNPSISDTYEPGSTFKTIVMASALDAGVINENTVCQDECSGPVKIGEYSIRTWNNEYNPGETVTQILERSDNVGMVYISQLLGADRFIDSVKKFGFGVKTQIDLEGEATANLRVKWGDIDVATSSFGQGIAVTSIQMVRAVSAIGNGGLLVEPRLVTAVKNNGATTKFKLKNPKRIISEKAALTTTQMMMKSAEHGEAKWRLPEGYAVAGKTGTAQIPVEGHYDAEKTIASFIGFFPANKPRFTMLVKLKEPKKSPWASETAAPLWFDLTAQIIRYYNLAPDAIINP